MMFIHGTALVWYGVTGLVPGHVHVHGHDHDHNCESFCVVSRPFFQSLVMSPLLRLLLQAAVGAFCAVRGCLFSEPCNVEVVIIERQE